MKNFTIGHLARETGCKPETIRYYESVGLMPEPFRSPGNQRLYGAEHIDRLAFIRHCRDLGFGLPSIRELMLLIDEPEQSCHRAHEIAETHLRAVQNRITRLEALKSELTRMLDHHHDDQVADCRVIEVLADHRHCLSHDHAAID